MKNSKSLLITIILMLVVISMGTYAWLSYRSNETAMVLTIGEVGSMSITLKPYKFNSSIDPTITYEGNDYVQVTASNETYDNVYNIGLYYKINNIPDELIDETFKYTILRSTDGSNYEEYDDGNFSNAASGSEYIILDNETLKSNTVYHYRVYLWIEGSVTDNTDMQGKVFDAELRASYEKIDYEENSDLKYSVTKVNNTSSNDVSTGFYTLSNYTCDNANTTLTFDTYSRKITANGIDKCDLEFTSVDNPLLYDIVEIGDYIEYTGNNGCSGNQCSGWNANQTATDIYNNYGYCYQTYYKFYVYGWRVLYKANNSVYIVSAGSPECVAYSPIDTPLAIENTIWPFSWGGTTVYFGSHYKYDKSSGTFALDTDATGYNSYSGTLSNLCTSTSCSVGGYYTCISSSETATCEEMTQVLSFAYSSYGMTYYNVKTYSSHSASKMILDLNTVAQKYCNTQYLSNGECNESTAHALNGDNFYKFTSGYYGSDNARYLYNYNDGGTYGEPYCYNSSNTYCGYNNDLIDNGGYYWFGSGFNSTDMLKWMPQGRNVSGSGLKGAYGSRPVLKLDFSIRVTGGKGTMENPYKISTRN